MMTLRTIRPLAWCLVASLAPLAHAAKINTDTVVDFDYCYGALDRADLQPRDREINQAEYLTFVKDFGRNTECLAQLQEMPLEILTVWNQLSCECLVDPTQPRDCCLGDNARIPNAGARQTDPFVQSEETYLDQVCLRTDQAVIAFCGPRDPALLLLGPAGLITSGLSDRDRILVIIAAILLGLLLCLILLCCCRRRRWCLFAGKEDDDDESSSSSSSSSDDTSDGGGGRGARQTTTEEGGDLESDEEPGDVEAPAADDDDDGAGGGRGGRDVDDGEEDDDPDGKKKRSTMEGDEEDDDALRSRWNRTVEGGDEEEDPDGNRRGGYNQFDLEEDPEDTFKLRHVERPEKEAPPEEPYELEHYEPDGGVYYPEREPWQGGYEADGGWDREEREPKAPVEPYRYKYEREVKEEPEPVDTRKQRKLGALGDGAVFDQLDGEVPEQDNSAPDDIFDWVIRSTLDTLDKSADDLKATAYDQDEDEDDKDKK